MTKEEIIEMARKAKLSYGSDLHVLRSVITFAKLVAEKEREECAKLCENSVEYSGDTLAEAIRARGQE